MLWSKSEGQTEDLMEHCGASSELANIQELEHRWSIVRADDQDARSVMRS